jgi:2-methylfumaryl-CoA hydratase
MKQNPGRFFEDFWLGQKIRHATPRTMTVGDAALYTALYGSRFAVHSSDPFARAIGYERAPLDDWLVFHVVFGKTVPDVSLNAVANLGYADGRFLKPVYPGTTLSAVSEVIGLRESSNRQAGIVWVRSTGFDEAGEPVLSYCRWVLVRKRDPEGKAPQEHVPDLPGAVEAAALGAACPPFASGGYDRDLAGAPMVGAIMRSANASTTSTA